MLQIVPDYYKEFHCIGGSCRHNCCIGWEIDIDENTAAAYADVPGEMGARLRANIDFAAEPPHFVLGAGERCPFLNAQNLCDIHLQLGEGALCGICADHPRFRNELPGRIESGIGLCCEGAARLILGHKAPVQPEVLPDASTGGVTVYASLPKEDVILALRDEVIALLQNRQLTLAQRLDAVLTQCGAILPQRSMAEWAAFLRGLERLDESWTQTLALLEQPLSPEQLAAFDGYMADRQYEYEQFTVYLVWRHFANAPDEDEAAVRAAFAALGYRLLHQMGATLYSRDGIFDFEQQAELARQFSSELEYCEENLYAIWDELYAALDERRRNL